jgi:hypothetical protein
MKKVTAFSRDEFVEQVAGAEQAIRERFRTTHHVRSKFGTDSMAWRGDKDHHVCVIGGKWAFLTSTQLRHIKDLRAIARAVDRLDDVARRALVREKMFQRLAA